LTNGYFLLLNLYQEVKDISKTLWKLKGLLKLVGEKAILQ
jgi:hypothetical protein